MGFSPRTAGRTEFRRVATLEPVLGSINCTVVAPRLRTSQAGSLFHLSGRKQYETFGLIGDAKAGENQAGEKKRKRKGVSSYDQLQGFVTDMNGSVYAGRQNETAPDF